MGSGFLLLLGLLLVLTQLAVCATFTLCRKVPRLYVDGSVTNDLAWAEVTEPEQPGHRSLRVREDPIGSTLSSTIFFRQPYNLDARWDASKSVLGAISAILYPSPDSPLLEVLDVGFRGMSGAIAIDTSQSEPWVLGMMSRRAKPIELKLHRKADLRGMFAYALLRALSCGTLVSSTLQIWPH